LGKAELNVGSWIGMLERASGVQAVYTGKPNSFAFELALQSMVLGNRQVAMIGDQVATDVIGANRIGMQTVLVRTGEFRPVDLIRNAVQPDFIIDSVQDIPDMLPGF